MYYVFDIFGFLLVFDNIIKCIYCHNIVKIMDCNLPELKKKIINCFRNINIAILKLISEYYLPTYRFSHKIYSRQKKANTSC